MKHVCDGVNHTIGVSVLLGSIRTTVANENTMCRKEFMEFGVLKFTTIVVLKNISGRFKLIADKEEKIDDKCINVRFVSERKGLNVVCKIIHNDKVIFKTGKASNMRSP